MVDRINAIDIESRWLDNNAEYFELILPDHIECYAAEITHLPSVLCEEILEERDIVLADGVFLQ